jgi:VCBS repeat-containing protein
MKLLLLLLSLAMLVSCQSGNDSSDMVSSRRRVSEEDEILARNSSVIDVKAASLTINSTVNNFNFRLIFNKIVNVNGCIPTVEVIIGSTSYTANYISGSGSTEHTYNVAFPTELDLNGPQVVGNISAVLGCLIDIKNKNTILTFSNKVISNVTIDQIGPTVSSFSINPSGSIGTGEILTIRANFNESVVINTSTTLDFTLGGAARSATYHSTNGSSQLLFRYTIQGGDVGSQTLSISSLPTNIEDNAGNSATGVATPFSELITVTSPNTAPVANNITPANFNEDIQSTITLSYTDANGDLASSCAISALSDVTVSSPCSCAAGVCTVGITSTPNFNGSASFSYTVTANGATSNTATASLTINPINDAPTISNVANQATNEDTATGAIAFTIADIDSTLNCATAVSGTSSDTAVVTNGAISIGGTAPNCTVTLTPVTDATGTSTITLTVTDGSLTAQDTFVLTVNGANDAPTISNVADQATNEDTALNSVAVTINDPDSTLNCASSLSGTSSDTNIITTGGITFGGTAPNCTVNFAPVANAHGAATITLTVSDGTLSAQDTLVLTVNPINDAPVISTIGNQTLDEDVASSAIAFTISDVDNTLNCSTSMAKSSSVTSVIANAGISFAGTAPNCTVTLTPVNNSSGSTTVTLTVSDGLLDASTNFNVTVDPLPDLLSVTEPVNNTYGQGSSLTFEVTFDTNTIVLGTPRLVLNIGGVTRYASMTTGNGSSTLIFTYNIIAGENDNDGISANTTIDLNGGSILSSTGDAFPLDISAQLSSLANVLVNTSLTPPGQVAAVTQTNLSVDSSQATFTWTAPAPGGAPITEYIVQYREAGTIPFTTLSPNPTTTSATISGLEVDTTYEVKVAAYNGVVGPSSSLLSFTTFFNPKSLGALVWYEARDINGTGVVPADGVSITTMVDKSGRNNNANLKAGETAGVIQTSGGRKVLRVSNANYQTINSLGETGNSHLEVYLIAKAISTPNSFVFCNENCTTLAARFGSHFPWSDGNAYVDLPGANRIQTAWGGNTTNFFAWTFRSSTTNGRVLERNGVPIITQGNRTDSTRLLKKWNFFGNATNGENWNADFVAVFVFDKILTPGQRQVFFNYIETNYGVVMP